MFLYQETLGKELSWLPDMGCVKRPERVLVVLISTEVRSVLARLDGLHWLMASLLYGESRATVVRKVSWAQYSKGVAPMESRSFSFPEDPRSRQRQIHGKYRSGAILAICRFQPPAMALSDGTRHVQPHAQMRLVALTGLTH